MEHLTITVIDEREDKTKPPLDPNTFKIAEVFEHGGVCGTEETPLQVEVFVRSADEKNVPTSYSHPVPTKTHKKIKVKDSKTGEKHAFFQEIDGEPDMSRWHLHLQLKPKEEATFGTMRAISRAVSREVYFISAVRAYGEMLGAMMTMKEFSDGATTFADQAPWAVS